MDRFLQEDGDVKITEKDLAEEAKRAGEEDEEGENKGTLEYYFCVNPCHLNEFCRR